MLYSVLLDWAKMIFNEKHEIGKKQLINALTWKLFLTLVLLILV